MSTKIFKFSEKDHNVIWLDEEGNQYHVHQFLLELRSKVFRTIDLTTEPFETKMSAEVCQMFFEMLYSCNIDVIYIKRNLFIHLISFFFEYDMPEFFDSCVERLISKMADGKIPLNDDMESLTLIHLSNQVWFSKSQILIDCVVETLRDLKQNFLEEDFTKLNPLVYKQYFLSQQMRIKNTSSNEEIEYFEEEDDQWYLAKIVYKKGCTTKIEFYRHKGNIDQELVKTCKTINPEYQKDFIRPVGTHRIVTFTKNNIFQLSPICYEDF
jgi:hypothetical protein